MKLLKFCYHTWLNLFTTSSLPRADKISYIPGPNFEPVKHILNGCPTPLKFVLLDLIKSFNIGSKVSLLKNSISVIFSKKLLIILIDFSSINFLSSLFITTLSFNINFELL